MSECNIKCPFVSGDNKYDVLIGQLNRETEELKKTATAKSLMYENKLNELCLYIKNNLSNELRLLFDTMKVSGELEHLITETVLQDVKALNFRTEGIINIKEFGAMGNGQCDDTRAIQTAIDYAIEKKYALYIPVGMFKVTSTLYLKDTINIYGDGQSTQTQEKSTILFAVGDKNIPLFKEAEGVTQLGRCTFNNVSFMRSRTANDGRNENEFAYGKSGVCIGFLLNESSLNRCTFVGFGAVCERAGITDFIDCDFVYCNHILANGKHCNAVSFYGCNVYACGTLLKANGNLSTVNFTNCWIEDFVTLLETNGSSILGLNFDGCTLTNTTNGEDVIKFTASPTFAREFITFSKCLLYFKTSICKSRPSGVEMAVTFNNSAVYYGGDGETIPIYGDSKFLSLSGANIDSLVNVGFDSRACIAHSPLQLSDKASSKPWQLSKPNNYVETRDSNLNRMIMLPVYYEFVDNPSLNRYFVFNTQAVSTGDWVLKFVYKADSGIIEKVIITL